MRVPATVGAILLTVLMSACATIKPHETALSIGPYQNFTGRLMVIEPTRRWQVMIYWNGTPEEGVARLTHAASNRIIQLSWHHETMLMLDNQSPGQAWKSITSEEMASNGIILPPQKLALILTGKLPKTLVWKSRGKWEGKINGIFLHVKWSDEKHRLELTDITHGRKAILIIES